MTSSIINLVIDNFLSNFIEIDKSQTYASLLSGVLELRNVKIKKELFSYIKLPYFILDIGYIGKIKIEMSMPFFYSYPINIYINDIFIFAKQKEIKNLNEKEEINSLKQIKNNLLEAEENLINKLSEIESTEPSMFSQIINNININIKNFLIRFEDNIINPNNPFALGILLKEINIKSLKENNNSDFCYKLISVYDLDIFMDCSNSFGELNYEKLIDNNIKDMVSLDMIKYLGNIFNFYVYCLSELNTDLIHDFILYKLSTDIKLTFNFNLENNNPKYELSSNEIEKIMIKLNLGQISNLFLLLSYYNLYYFFQLGISKKIFNKNFSEKDKEKYILEYIKYYYNKYKENKNENDKIKKLEENITYEEIKHLRKIGINYIYKLYCEEKELEEKLKNENNKWFFSTDKNLIKELNDKLTNINNQIKEKIKYYLLDKYNLLFSEKDLIYNNTDKYWNLPDDFIFYIAKLTIKNLNLIICDIDTAQNNNNNLLELNIKDMMISYIGKKYNASYSLTIKNIELNQNIVTNNEYDKILIAKSEKEEEFIFIEYQTNKDEFGNFINKIIFKSGIQIIFFINLYQLQYINYNILSCLYAFISFIEIPRYVDDNFSDYIQLGYVINENNKLSKKKIQQENYSIKYDYDINIKNPIIIIPQDILNPENKKCIIISVEDITIKSNLSTGETLQKDSVISIVTEENIINKSNSNYESCLNDSSIMDNIYDKHFLNITGVQIYLSNYCTKEYGYKNLENILVSNFNLSILYKTLIDLSDKNGNYNISSFSLDIKEIFFTVDEFQILFLLFYLKKLKKQNEYLIENQIINLDTNDEYTKKYNNEKIYEFIQNQELKGTLEKNELFLLTKNIIKKNENKKPKNEKEISGEDEFYKKPNKFLIEVKIAKIKFILYKIYSSKKDLTKEVFLELELNNIIFSKFTSYSDNVLMKLYLKDISLLNPEKDEKKNFLLPKEFQLLIKNDEENINCITYSSLYKKYNNEYNTNIEINNLDILISFEALTRIYTFAMYYFGKYQDIYYDHSNQDLKKFVHIRQSDIYIERSSRFSKEDNTVKIYKISNQNIFKFELKNSFLRMPSDESNTDKPIFSMKLNLFYEQSSNKENEHVYDINNKTLIEGKLLYDNKTMNIMIYESDFDIMYFNEKGIRNDKIISNYRIQYRSKYSYLLSKKNSISNMNILVEPLILNVNLYQLKYLMNLYFDLMKFLFESLYINYVPFVKFEDVIFIKGKPVLLKRRKTIKVLVNHVVELNKVKNKIFKLSKKKKKKINENIINSFNSINFQLDKIYVRILDDNYYIKNKKEKRVLLAFEMSKIFFNKIYNSNPKDKTNIGNDLFSIIANTSLNIDKYIVHNLYKYMNCTFTLELYHYNLEYSDFEPFIEPFNVQYLSFQTHPIFRAKTYINIENIININVSTNSMKILNIFMSKYSKENPNGNIIDNGINIYTKKKSEDFLRMISKDIQNIEDKNEEIVIKLTNKTGVLINFWFDFDKDNIIKINNNEIIHLTNKQIYKTRKRRKLIQKKESERNTFSFQILNYESIKKINLNSSDNLYFKTKINNEEKYIYYNLKINTNSFIKEIIFESSLVFLNESKFDDLILSTNDDLNLNENSTIILQKNKKVCIPLSWSINSKNIFLQMNNKSEKFLIYNNISEIIQFEELTQREIKEKQKQTDNIKNSLENKLNNFDKINLHHPKYKNYVSTYVLQRFNKKNSKSISIKDEKNEDIYLYFDYCSMSYKYYHINSEKIFHFLENTKKSTEFIILIRPIANITNYTPYDIVCYNNKDNSKLDIAKRQTIELYNDKWLNEEFLIKLNLEYNNEKFETEFMNLNSNNNYINTLNFFNENKDILRCNVSHNLLNKYLNIFENEFESYSFLSYNYIIYFDFIINNRIEFDLYGIDSKEIKNKGNKDIFKFNSEILSVFSSNNGDIQNLLINSSKSNFNGKNKINVNAIDLENVIEIEYEKNIYNILCKASNSLNYIYSNILLFEPKYILINDLDFDIYIQQINEDNKPIDEIKKIPAKKYIPLYYKTQKKIIYKIGLKLSKDNPLISLSGSFELDNSMEYELKVEVDESYIYKYPKNVFNIGDKVFLYFRIKDKITDEGNVYLFITFPDFPILEIDNRTKELIKIYETKKEDEPILINPMSKIPFIWSNNVILKNKFICQILNKKIVLSFSQYNQTVMEINENKIIYISNYQKNSLTGTRCITFEEKDKLIDIKNDNKKEKSIKNKFKSLNKINIFIKGIGLSFLDEAPKEIFYISFYEMRLTYTNLFISLLNTSTEDFEFHLKNFQIDSSLNNTIKTLIYPKKQNIPSLELDNNYSKDDINFISLSIVKNSSTNIAQEIKNVKYPKIDLCIQEINVKIDQNIVMNLIGLIKNYTSKLIFLQMENNALAEKAEEEEKLLNEIKIPTDELKKETKNSNKILINHIFLSAMKINLSFKLELSSINITYLPKFISRIIGSLGSSLISISDSPLKFSEIIIENIYLRTSDITHTILKSYINQSLFQIYKILGSFDLIGNPVQLIEKIGTGFFEFVNEPRKGLLKGPSQFGKGLAKGFAGLLNGIIGGAFDSVSKISGTLYNLVQNLTGNNKDLIIDDDNEPSNIIMGASQGIIDGMQELYDGFTGFVINPIEKATDSNDFNMVKFVKDLSKGLFRFAVSPVNFILRIGNSISVGTKNTFNYFYIKTIKNQRFRFPRYIKPNTLLTIYDPDLSAAKEFLYKIHKIEEPNIIFVSQFYCENKRYYGKIAYFILTNEIIILLSNKYEVILNMNVSDINEVELKYNGKYFEFVCRLNEDKYKIILINKINNAFACEIFCILENIINIRNRNIYSTLNKIPYIKKFKDGLKENIKIKKLKSKNNE